MPNSGQLALGAPEGDHPGDEQAMTPYAWSAGQDVSGDVGTEGDHEAS
jgi:hypothetical protein